MSRCITISIYDKNKVYYENENSKEACHVRVLQTDLTPKQVEELLDVKEEYTIEITEGSNLCFIDFQCHGNFSEKIIDIVNSIPESNAPKVRNKTKNIRTLYYEDPEHQLPTKGVAVQYRYRHSKYAGSFADWVMTVTESPWFWLVLGIIIGDIKDFIIKQFKKKGKSQNYIRTPLNVKKLYGLIAVQLGYERSDLQIVYIELITKKIYRTKFRSKNGYYFDVECKRNGKVIRTNARSSYSQQLADKLLLSSTKGLNRVRKLDEYVKEIEELLIHEGITMSEEDKNLCILKAVARYEANNRTPYVYFLCSVVITFISVLVALVTLFATGRIGILTSTDLIIAFVYLAVVVFCFVGIAITTRVKNLRNELVIEFCEQIEKERHSSISSDRVG